MHPTKSKLLPVALGLAVVAPVGSSAQPAGYQPPPNLSPWMPTIRTPLEFWINSTPLAAPSKCPEREHHLSVTGATRRSPYFSFNNKSYVSCLVDGPYKWDNREWWVQRIIGSAAPGKPPVNAIRVCSLAAKNRPNPTSFFRGPCGGGVGPKGCQICVEKGVPVPEASQPDG